MPDRVKKGLTLLAAGLLLAVASGCGVRGSLEAPPEAKAAGTATSSEAADAGSTSAAAPKGHKPFILDRMLQ